VLGNSSSSSQLIDRKNDCRILSPSKWCSTSMQSTSSIEESVRRLELALFALTEKVQRVLETVERIDRNAERNLIVAEKYGDRADSLFSVVDTVGAVMSRANPINYIPRFSLEDSD
jgi:hypothetical protein